LHGYGRELAIDSNAIKTSLELMAKKKEGSGLMSSAGLMRYYDAEETAIIVEPKTVVTVAVAAGLAILGLNAYYHIWP
jgi:preprotein translocase subunit Sec61beta